MAWSSAYSKDGLRRQDTLREGCVGESARGMRVWSLRDKAQNVVEYGLLITSIVLVVLLGVARFGTLIEPWFAALAGRITTLGT